MDTATVSDKTDIAKANIVALQLDRYEIFKAQEPENGEFDGVIEIDEKKLYVHKFFLVAASETMKAMISDRWNQNKDEPIKIENYSFDDFFQFLCFIYSGECELTEQNIVSMIDMAEFYGVSVLKNYCDVFLSQIQNYLTVENVEEMANLADRYSLTRFTESLRHFISSQFPYVFHGINILHCKKFFIKLVSLSNRWDCKAEESFFEDVYKWAENQVTIKHAKSLDEDLNFDDAIKDELADILPNIKFSNMSAEFIGDFIVSDKTFLFSTTAELYEILVKSYRYNQEEKFFKAVYKLAEKEATEKQMDSDDDGDFDIQQAIKSELSEIIPDVDFYSMKLEFVIEFLVSKRFLLGSFKLFQILYYCRRLPTEEEEFFKAAYAIAEEEALEKKNASTENEAEEIFDLAEAIKKELRRILSSFKFYQMTPKFITEFVVAKRILSSKDVKDVYKITVKITNNRKVLTGTFKDVFNIYDRVQQWKHGLTKILHRNEGKQRFFKLKCGIPSTPSNVVVQQRFSWCLCLEKDGVVTVKRNNWIAANDYLIAELKYRGIQSEYEDDEYYSEDDESEPYHNKKDFSITDGNHTYISATRKKFF